MRCCCASSSTASCRHSLLDASERSAAVGQLEFDANAVARLQKGCLRSAVGDGLQGAPLLQARDTAFRRSIGNGAAAQDRAGTEAARLADVLEQLKKRKLHFRGSLRIADAL